MQTLSDELKDVIGRRLQRASAREILAIASALCVDEAPAIEVTSSAIEVPARRFEVIACGTDEAVRDNTTGLIWTRGNIGDRAMNWSDAQKACSELGTRNFWGANDWRLPTVQELLTLVNYERTDPAIDIEAFPSCKSSCYWTATPYASSPPDCAWCVGFYYGGSRWSGQDSGCFVRAVRASQ